MAHDPIYRTCAHRTIYGDGEAVSGCLAEAGGVVAGEALAPLGASPAKWRLNHIAITVFKGSPSVT